MLERDDFEKRYHSGKPISIAEFLYPIAQAYDSVAVHADVEMGGTDQKFNLLVGRKYQEEFEQKPQIVMTMPLIEGTDGTLKMSKSYNNYVAVDDTPENMYGKIMSIPDKLMFKYARLLTNLNVEEAQAKINSNELHPMEFKKQLAFEVTKWLHNEEKAVRAQERFIKTFSNHGVPDNVKEILAVNGMRLPRFLKQIGAVSSSSEARRLINQGGVKIDNATIEDPFFVTNFKGGEILRVGKLKFYKVKNR